MHHAGSGGFNLSHRILGRALMAGLLLAGADEAAAEILKCKAASGQITYTQGSCPPGTTPLELPDSVSSDTGSSFARNGGSSRPLSPRAAALKKSFEACGFSAGNGKCAEFTELSKFCTDRAHWDTADCAAVREVNESFVADMGRLSDRFDESTRRKCREDNDKKACDQLACPISMMMEGSDSQVRACSRSRGFPSTNVWAQISERTYDYNGMWTGEYLCLKFVDTFNPIGQRISIRPAVMVSDEMKGGERVPGYSTSAVRRETFPTKEAAVAAGCKAQSEKLQNRDKKGE
jgi:hypothetical protein